VFQANAFQLDAFQAGPNPPAFRIVLSSNIASGGEATTARLTAPSGKTSGDFTTGRRWDDENGTDSLTIAVDDWTTIAWSIEPNGAAVANAEVYEFRIVADGVALDTYTVTPQWTIGTPAAPSLPMPQSLLQRIPALLRF
jgi:hypothetical protein